MKTTVGVLHEGELSVEDQAAVDKFVREAKKRSHICNKNWHVFPPVKGTVCQCGESEENPLNLI